MPSSCVKNTAGFQHVIGKKRGSDQLSMGGELAGRSPFFFTRASIYARVKKAQSTALHLLKQCNKAQHVIQRYQRQLKSLRGSPSRAWGRFSLRDKVTILGDIAKKPLPGEIKKLIIQHALFQQAKKRDRAAVHAFCCILRDACHVQDSRSAYETLQHTMAQLIQQYDSQQLAMNEANYWLGPSKDSAIDQRLQQELAVVVDAYFYADWGLHETLKNNPVFMATINARLAQLDQALIDIAAQKQALPVLTAAEIRSVRDASRLQTRDLKKICANRKKIETAFCTDQQTDGLTKRSLTEKAPLRLEGDAASERLTLAQFNQLTQAIQTLRYGLDSNISEDLRGHDPLTLAMIRWFYSEDTSQIPLLDRAVEYVAFLSPYGSRETGMAIARLDEAACTLIHQRDEGIPLLSRINVLIADVRAIYRQARGQAQWDRHYNAALDRSASEREGLTCVNLRTLKAAFYTLLTCLCQCQPSLVRELRDRDVLILTITQLLDNHEAALQPLRIRAIALIKRLEAYASPLSRDKGPVKTAIETFKATLHAVYASQYGSSLGETKYAMDVDALQNQPLLAAHAGDAASDMGVHYIASHDPDQPLSRLVHQAQARQISVIESGLIGLLVDSRHYFTRHRCVSQFFGIAKHNRHAAIYNWATEAQRQLTDDDATQPSMVDRCLTVLSYALCHGGGETTKGEAYEALCRIALTLPGFCLLERETLTPEKITAYKGSRYYAALQGKGHERRFEPQTLAPLILQAENVQAQLTACQKVPTAWESVKTFFIWLFYAIFHWQAPLHDEQRDAFCQQIACRRASFSVA